MQEAVLKALRGFAGFEPGTNFKAWIFRILRNTYLTSRSGLAARRTVSLDEEWDENGRFGATPWPEAAINYQTPELDLIRFTDRAALDTAMGKLPPPLLEIVLLCDVEELKYREVAAILDIPIGTVMSRLARARAQLRKSLEAARQINRGFGA